MSKKIRAALTMVVMLITIIAACSFSSSAASGKWISAWGTAPTEIGVEGYDNITAFIGEVTARVVLTPTADGTKLRVRVSNVCGDKPLTLTRVTVSKSAGGPKIDTSTTKIVTFNQGYQGVTVPAGKEYYSDPVVFDVKAQENIAVTFYAHEFTEIRTMGLSGADTYITVGEDATSAESFGFGEELGDEEVLSILTKILGVDLDFKLGYSFVKLVPCISGLDVYSDKNAYSVVVAGDGTVANEFPTYLSQAINAKNVKNVGVSGKGLIGNRLLGSGLGMNAKIYGPSLIERFNRDVLSQPGVEYVIVKIGANDIIHPVFKDIKKANPNIKQPTADELIAGYKKIFKMCHDAGVKVVVTSITQWKGSTGNYFNSGEQYVRTKAQQEADWKIARTVNSWLEKSTLHDGYINLTGVSADTKDSAKLLAEYTIDGIHPSDSLQKVWANYMPLSLVGVGNDPSSLKLNTSSMTIYVGSGKTLTATILPKNANDKSVTWSSSNSTVAKVSKDGYVLGVSNGTATITCKSNKGSLVAKCTVKVNTKTTGVKLNKTSASVYTTKSFTLVPTVLPADATNKKVTWKSSNTKVATVSSKGVVTGVGSGTATITCTTENSSKKATCTVKILKKKEVASISISKTSLSLYKGKTAQLTAKVSPSDATFKSVKWSSSNTKIATVDSNGKVKAIGSGTATITCKSVDNPMVKVTCTVKVKIKATGVKLDKTSAKLYVGQKGKLAATVSPSSATNKNVTWKSENTAIVRVSETGTIKGVKVGTTYVRCTTKDGGFVAKCKVTVTKAIKSTSVKVNVSSATINDGTTGRLSAVFTPSNTSDKSVTWSSSNTKVAKVYSDGKVYGVNPGKATITCKANDTGKTAKCVVTVKAVVPTSVKINKTMVNINNNKTLQLTATVSPSNATNKSVKWSSSDSSIVYVNANGVIKGLKPGKSAVITCTTVSGKKVAKCTVKVNPIKVTKVALNKTSATIAPGKSFTITATVSPSNATNKTVKWTSNNTSVATVNSKGVVKGVANGKAIIGCVTNDGGYVAVCTVQVKTVKVSGVKFDKTNVRADAGAKFKINAEVLPSNATNKKLVWSSSNSTVAKVDQSGNVTALKSGRCEIKAKSVDGNWIAICSLRVN